VAQKIESRHWPEVALKAWWRLTDLSQAIDHATEMFGAAPFASERSIVNIIGNGEDNVGEDADIARDRIVRTGAVVNGVVLGGNPSVLDYYRRRVIGGPGAFVMSTNDPTTMVEVMTRKFLYDIVMNASRGDGDAREQYRFEQSRQTLVIVPALATGVP
jgi:Protein of unknown function (DUF1194)